MAKKESSFWNKFYRYGGEFFNYLQRIEDRTEIALPDILALAPSQMEKNSGIALFIELKVAEIGKSGKFTIPWRQGQPAWHADWVRRGGISVVMVEIIPKPGFSITGEQYTVALMWPQPHVTWVGQVQQPYYLQTLLASPQDHHTTICQGAPARALPLAAQAVVHHCHSAVAQ